MKKQKRVSKLGLVVLLLISITILGSCGWMIRAAEKIAVAFMLEGESLHKWAVPKELNTKGDENLTIMFDFDSSEDDSEVFEGYLKEEYDMGDVVTVGKFELTDTDTLKVRLLTEEEMKEKNDDTIVTPKLNFLTKDTKKIKIIEFIENEEDDDEIESMKLKINGKEYIFDLE